MARDKQTLSRGKRRVAAGGSGGQRSKASAGVVMGASPRPAPAPSIHRARQRLSPQDFRNLITISSASIACFDFAEPISCASPEGDFVDLVFGVPSRCLEASLTFALGSGYAAVDQVLGRSLSQLLPQELGFGGLIRRWWHLSLSGQGFEVPLVGRDGSHLTVQAVVYGRIERENLSRLWVVLRDVTPQARAVQALSLAELHYRSLVERPGLLLIRIRPDGSHEYMSRHSQETLGISTAQLNSGPDSFLDLVHPDDLPHVRCLLESRQAGTRDVREAEVRLRLASGHYTWFALRQFPKLSPSGDVECFDLIAFDIQNQRELELKLAQLSKSAIVGQMSAGIAHDLNNHLTAIQSQLDRAGTMAQPGPVADALHAAQQAVRDCYRMGQQLLAVGRSGTPLQSAVRVASVAAQAVELIRPLIPSRIALEIIAHDDGLSVWADEAQLRQVIINLVLNARDAVPGAGRIQVEIRRVSASEVAVKGPASGAKSLVSLSVKDSGTGISAEDAARIFTPFFTTKRDHGGHGLGLSMVKALVEAQNGTIVFRSDATVGTTFIVLLPILGDEGAGKAVQSSERAGTNEKIEVIVAEDNGEIRRSLADSLSALGHRVEAVASGAELSQLMSRHPPGRRLLILDEFMPDQIGSEALPGLLRLNPELHVILMSGAPLISPAGQDAAARTTCLQKPFSLVELVDAVERLQQGRLVPCPGYGARSLTPA